MRAKLTKIATVATLGLALAFTFSCSMDDPEENTSSSSGVGTPSSSSNGGIPSGGWRICSQISQISEQCSDNAYAEFEACLEDGDYEICYYNYSSKEFGCSFLEVACNGISTASCTEHYKSADCFEDIFPDGGDQGNYCSIEDYSEDGDYYERCLLIGERASIYSANVCRNVLSGEVVTYRQCRANYAYIDNALDSGDMGSYCYYDNDCDLIGGQFTLDEEYCLGEREGEVITYLQCKNKGARIYNQMGGGEWD